MENYNQKYPLIWEKDGIYLKIFCSIPNIATGILLKRNSQNIVIDPGDGILRDLNREIGKEGVLSIEHIFITHGHHDHIGGLWSLFTYFAVMNKTGKLKLYFPEGSLETKTIIEAFKKVYVHQMNFEIETIEIALDKEISKIGLDNCEVLPFEVNHNDFDSGKLEKVPSLGFKFFIENTSICYGGDTALCDNLVEMVKDSDLAIIEAGSRGKSNEMHLSKEDAIKIGKTAKEFFLVHQPE